ncbi:hypothetical protein BSKO_11619 [Bryopsis sp. KO-2023]|nr:hypothetical protein BSKO_11619 [Bryopsis sp. KO-2023]
MAQQQQGNQPLPNKEANLLRQIVKFYESKQYKKGLKSADQILKKFPNHGETLAMKGLTLNCLEKKEEAYEYVRKGLQSDVKSHVCWHVYGLLYRSDRLYKKAITCYLNALKHDKDNIQILRDLALLQIQMRDLNGFLDTRHRLLQLRPGNRNNWIAFAIGHFLNKNYEVAVQVLSAYEGTLEEVSKEEAYEHSEILLFKATILEDSGKIKESIELLDRSKGMIKDKLGWMEMRARLLMKSDSADVARKIYRQLLKLFPDNYNFHQGLLKSLQIEELSPGKWRPEDQEKLDDVYKTLIEENPMSLSCKRIPLDYKEGQPFLDALEDYVARFINKGIPSLFSDLKPLYRYPDKSKSLGEFFESYRKRLLEESSSQGEKHPSSSRNPQAVVWVLYYLAQHYDYTGQPESALERISEALKHTPTVSELHLVHSKILKHVGDFPGAAEAADEARKLDLADRYLNCVAVKAALRAGRIEEAEKMAALFTKDENQIYNLIEMQCMWYEIATGNAHLRNKDYGKALKKFLGVSKHFEDFVEDQFDFHGYCVRKMTLRSYMDLLKMEDELYGEISYSKAAWGAIRCYLDLADNPSLGKPAPGEQVDSTEGMTPAELKAHNLKQKKKEREAKRKADEKARKEKAAKGKKGPNSPGKVDPDPDGEKLAAVEDPQAEATKLVTMLRQHAGGRIQTQELAFEVYLRKKRMLLALSAVKRGLQLEGRESSKVHNMIIRFCKQVADSAREAAGGSEATSKSVAAEEVIQEGVQDLLQGASLEQYNKAYLEQNGNKSLLARATAAEMQALLNPKQKPESVKLIMEGGGPVGGGISKELLTQEGCRSVHELLLGPLGDEKAAEEWKKRCSQVFQWSSYFGGPKQTQITTNGVLESMEELQIPDHPQQ